MDGNGGMFSNLSGGSGMLGLEMSLNSNQSQLQQPLPPQQSSSNLLHRQHHQQPPYASDPARHPPPGAKQAYPYAPKPRNSPFSDDDEQPNGNSNHTANEDSGGDGKMTKGSPWQRMKWTDNMVRLLIMVVFYIGDDVATEAASDQAAKKKGGAGSSGGGGVLQKKGKWKSVSRAMMERGFYVSPQQCEDKFNDLNKRYKRVNDILGKGTACKVVENQSLLETMDLPPKMKEEAKKLLNSKHLFFREMCAYHNSPCGGGGSGGAGNHHSSPPEVTAPAQAQQQKCLHSNAKNALVSRSRSNEDDDEEEAEEDDDSAENTHHHYHYHNHHHQEEEDDEDDGFSKRKRGRNNDTREQLNCTNNSSALLLQFGMEVSNVTQDVTKSVREKRQWMKAKMIQLEEQKVGFEGEGFELEKQRLKWVKFSYKKEREMEVERLRNERRKLENDRMVILLKQKELELVDLQQQQYSSNKRATDPSSITG